MFAYLIGGPYGLTKRAVQNLGPYLEFAVIDALVDPSTQDFPRIWRARYRLSYVERVDNREIGIYIYEGRDC